MIVLARIKDSVNYFSPTIGIRASVAFRSARKLILGRQINEEEETRICPNLSVHFPAKGDVIFVNGDHIPTPDVKVELTVERVRRVGGA